MNKSLDMLTERELEILHLVAEGLSNGEIADQLVLSLGTVKWYNGQIFDKLDVKNRTQAIVRGRELGLLGDDEDDTPRRPALLTNLPAYPLPFLGRQDELGRIAALLRDCRLLTLVGPGGIGKTRIAVEAARAHLDHFADGVYFVALAPLSSPEPIMTSIGTAMNITFNEGVEPRTHLLLHLRDKHTLLVLDNFDELLDGVGFVTEILQNAPGVKVLVTSRERLNIQEETLFRVEGMSLPDAESVLDNGAVQLFVQCSRRVRPEMPFNDEDLREVARICQLVEGMPLGIVLAAAWVEMLSPREIADEIARSFDFLETDMRNMPPRHRSVRVVFESAWHMLTEAERAVFARLSPFRGGFTRGGAADVANASLPTLMALVNKSLLRREPGGRFEIHNLLRQYAAEQLTHYDSADHTRRAHSEHYLTWLQATQVSDYEEVEVDFENIRAGWNWAVDHDQHDLIERTLDSLYEFSTRRSRHWDALHMFDYAITCWHCLNSIDPQHAQNLLRLRECRGKIRQLTGDFMGAVADLQHVRHAAHAAGDAAWERDLLIRLGQLYRKTEQHNEAIHYLTKVADFSRRSGNLRGVADALYHMGTVAWDEGDNAQARIYHQEAADIASQLNLRDIVAVQAHHGMGESLMMGGQPQAAIDHFITSRQIAEEIGDVSYISENLQMVGWASIGLIGSGDYQLGEVAFTDSLPMSLAAHMEWHNICSYTGLGLIQGALGRYGEGIATVSDGLRRAEALGVIRFISLALDNLGQLYQDLHLLDRADAAHTRVIELMLKSESTFWLPRAQANHAINRIRQGDLNVENDLIEAFALAISRNQEFHAVRSLEGLAELGIARQDAAFAQKYADKLLQMAEARGMIEMTAQARRWRGEAFLLTGQLDAAHTELTQAAAAAARMERVRLIHDTHQALARRAELAGSTASAQHHRHIANNAVRQMADSLDSDDLRVGLAVLRV